MPFFVDDYNDVNQVGAAEPAVNGLAGFAEPMQWVPANGIQEEGFNMPKAKVKSYLDAIMPNRSASPPSDEYRALASQIAECRESYLREWGELERALAELSRLTEVVRDIGSTVQTRTATLQRVATQLETWRLAGTLQGLLDSAKEPAAGHSALAQAPQPAVVGAQQVVPGLWQQGPV